MYIERVPNRNSPPAVLLRESYREGDKVRKKTIANLSKLPDDVIENLKGALKGGKVIDNIESVLKVKRSLPHGHVAAILGTIKNIGLEPIIESENSKRNAIIKSLIAARIIDPKSKLATSRGLRKETANSSLSKILNLEKVTEDDLYEALDWLGDSQEAIEEKLAAKELKEGSLVLYQYCSVKDFDFSLRQAEEQGDRSRERDFRLSPPPPAPVLPCSLNGGFGLNLRSIDYPTTPLPYSLLITHYYLCPFSINC